MTISLMHIANELREGHDGSEIPEAKRVYFQRRLRDRFFDFLREGFEREEANGLTQAKLARRIHKSPEVISRWLNAPSNLTLDTISDLMIGIGAEEPTFRAESLINNVAENSSHLAEDEQDSSDLLKSVIDPSQKNKEITPPLLGNPSPTPPPKAQNGLGNAAY